MKIQHAAFALLFMAAPAALVEAQESPATPTLGPELLVAHPARLDGDNERWTLDVLAALAAEPDSAYAVDAVRLLGDLQVDEGGAYRSDERLDAFAALADAVSNQEAAVLLRRLVLLGVTRRRFSDDPYPLEDDYFADTITGWRQVGPVGRADDASPASAPALRGTPELEQGAFSASYPAAAPVGVETDQRVEWRHFPRGRHISSVESTRGVYHDVGQVFLAAFVRFPDGATGEQRQLIVRGPGSFRAYWNGQLAADRTGQVRPEINGRGRVLVKVNPGWNALLVRVPASSGGGLFAHIMMPDGTKAEFAEPGPEDPLLLPWAQGGEVDPWPDPMLQPLTEEEHGPFGPVLYMQRLMAAGRADESLLVPQPEGSEAHGPWRLGMIEAIESARHLDGEVKRRRVLGHMEALEDAGLLYATVRQRRVNQFMSEDRPFEALDAVDEWIAAAPERPWPQVLRSDVLVGIDATGTLSHMALKEVARAFPAQISSRERLAQVTAGTGDDAQMADMYWSIVEASGTTSAAESFIASLGAAPDPRVGILIDRVKAWQEMVPDDRTLQVLLTDLLERQGRIGEVLQTAEAEAMAAPHDPDAWWLLANERYRAGDPEGTLEAIQRELAIRPADETSRRWSERLGASDEAMRFFAAYAPDMEAATARAQPFVEGASLVEVLDDGMLFVFSDGSTHMRATSATRICDPSGIESMSALPIIDGTRSIRVVGEDGEVKEPTNTGGEWVLPALEVGDVVEVVWDRVLAGEGGLMPAGLQSWRFASFDRSFPTTRWVVRLPNDLKFGSLKTLNFEGSALKESFGDGVVHTFQDSIERQVPESGMPSYQEVLPLAVFGGGQMIDDDLRGYEGSVNALTDLTADIAIEVDRFIAEVAPPGEPDLVRAKSLYDALEDRMLDFEGAFAAGAVWQSKRGYPIYLYGALLTRAGIDHQWAALTKGVSPELDPDPVSLFENINGLSSAVLRLEESGEVVWVMPGSAPGTPFGMLPRTVAGAPGYLIEPAADGALQPITLPRGFVEDVWDGEVSLRVELAPADGGAPVLAGTFRSATVSGMIGLGQLREVTVQQRQSFARSQAANFAPGADIESAAVVLDGSAGPGLVIRFDGRWPGFLTGQEGEAQSARVPFVPLELGTRFGAAERRWPLALRSSMRLRATIELELADAWTFDSGPGEAAYEREGLQVRLERKTDGETLQFSQTYLEGGAFFEPSEMAGFLKEMTAIEGEFERPLRLTPAETEGDEGGGD